MHAFRVNDRTYQGLLARPPEKEFPYWHLLLDGGAGGTEALLPMEEAISTYLTVLDDAVRAASKGEVQNVFPDLSQERAMETLREVYQGWAVDQLFFQTQGSLQLRHDHRHQFRGGPCLIHACPDGEEIEYLANAYSEVSNAGRIQRVYKGIDEAAGVTMLESSESANGAPRHVLFRLELGASFRIRRKPPGAGDWREICVQWKGRDLTVYNTDRDQRERRERVQEPLTHNLELS